MNLKVTVEIRQLLPPFQLLPAIQKYGDHDVRGVD